LYMGKIISGKLTVKEDVTVNNPVPRGRMLDRNLQVVVDNEAKRAITYTNKGASQKEMLQVAENLAKLIQQDIVNVRDRDRKDFWILKNPEESDALITAEEQKLFKQKKLSDKEVYALKLERIGEDKLNKLTNEELEVLAIFRIMNSGYKFAPQIVKNENVSPEEFAIVSENLQNLPGVDATIDWERSYKFGPTLRTVLGAVSSSKEGLPATTTYNVGSAVKGATILTGFKTGAIAPHTFFDDKGIKIRATPLKASYDYLGVLNEVDALKKSSNVYMFHTAIKIGKGRYQYEQPLSLQHDTFDLIRNSFASFGLGVRTGIDLPNEQAGFKGQSRLPGYALDLVIGQYDTYSTMQLAQYISAIANGGYRMQPQVVREIHEPKKAGEELGPVYFSFQPRVLNSVDVKQDWLNRVQLGFKKALTEAGGKGPRFFGNASYLPAGKTGTAEAFYNGPLRSSYGKIPPEVLNLSLVAYAPSNNPKVAMAVLVPWAYQGKNDHKANLKIGRKVMDAYFGMNSSKEPKE
jgi:cell division protein FtsI/penicillin-binding protein 2